MNTFRSLFAVVATVILNFSVTSVSAQSSFEGIVTTEIKMLEVPKGEEGMEGLMNQTMTSYFKGGRSRIEMTSMGMNSIIISDQDKKEVTMLMDMLGQKIAMVMPMEEGSPSDSGMEFGYEGEKITMTNETKTISGYSCRKGIVQFEEGQMEVWFAESVKEFPMYDSRMPGVPIQYIVDEDDMKMQITVKEIKSQSVPEKMFSVPSEYTVKSAGDMEQFMPFIQGAEEGED